MSWLPGTHRAEPWTDHVPHQPHRVQDARAAVHQVADEDRLAALGVDDRPGCPRARSSPSRRSSTRSRVAASSSSSSSQQPWTSPMMSNGPCSSRLSFQSGTRSTVAASTSSGVSSTKTWRKPSRSRPRSDRRSCDIWLRTTCGPKSRSARSRLRSWQTCSGRSSTMATGRQWYCRASSTSGLRASGWTLVASIDRQPPQGQPLAGDEVQHLEGVLRDGLVVLVVADHPPAGVRREDLGRQEVPAGERALARAAGADQDDEGQFGNRDVHVDAFPAIDLISVEKSPSASARPAPRLPAPPAGTAPHSRTVRRPPVAQS